MSSPRFGTHVTISGLGLTLREWTDDDIPAMAELFDDPDVARFTPLRSPFDLEAARAYLDAARRARAEDRKIQLAVTSDGRTPQGEILLFRCVADDPAHRFGGPAAELGYAIGLRHRRQGLASRAVRLAAGYARETLGFSTLVLRIDPDNTGSERVATASGFELTELAPLSRGAVRDRLRTWRHVAGGAG
ncbi:GNAT family N-acetyltransferase [Actinomadura sp. NTSP31]|uniref:GNAT family N-acetyltransferase n=1 Tax=Actinomadura sp. NTSP31 TaxID=1735447 RepID=UPI0035BF0509